MTQAGTAIYVRVSSTGQLGRDGDDDGYSIPAQIKACEREAELRGLSVAKAYIERAESARSDDRPVLQQMMRELPELGVGHLIVPKVDRLARNRLDDAVLYERLVGMRVKLVSASENIDETPAGRLMHGMLATFAEYYSNNLASEIRKGLQQKHQTGGTPFKAPLGYLPKRELIGNQDIRTVIVDEQRAPLIKLAFDLYATGDWTLHRLAAHLEALGLRSRPTPKRGECPIGLTSVHKILKNVYYVGIVEYRGNRVPGRHVPLIDQTTFDRVQALLAAHAVAGDRPYRHEHYLRGTVYCAECGGRLLYGKYRGKGGGSYEYFSCINRRGRGKGGSCTTRHYPVKRVERGVEDYYRTVRLSKRVQEQIRSDVCADAAERAAVIARDVERHERKLKSLADNQARLVHLSYQGLVSNEVLAREQDRLATEQQQTDHLLRLAKLNAEDIEASLKDALAKTTTPHATYVASDPLERRLLNQTFFTRLLVGEDSEVVGSTLTPIYAALSAWEPGFGQPTEPTAAEPETRNPEAVSRRRGLHVELMVETVGIEPTSAIA
jgi:site-specific DNA recombinase